MLLRQVLPPGADGPPEAFHTDLRLGERAPANRPYVFCNFVASADGKASAGGRTAPLGGDGDRAVFHLLRTQADAILAGTGTLAVERYGVMTRSAELAALRAAEGRPEEPLAVVISRSGEVPFDIPLFAAPGARVAVFTPEPISVPSCAAEVFAYAVGQPGLALSAVLGALRHDHGIASLLCEGGPTLFGALLADDLVDELFLTLAPALVGAHEHPLTGGPALREMLPLRVVHALERDGHLF